MSNNSDRVYVRSNVKRDLLQSAALFKTDHQVVWEYLSNSLQYVDPNVSPHVIVRLDNPHKLITIRDNGRGMTFSNLKNFFYMHGENLDRKAGRPGRGMFGTGKSAAFGIADVLTVTTRRLGKRTAVRLRRPDVEAMTDGSDIPVEIIEREIADNGPNGTTIEITGVHLPRLDQKRIIGYIERQLARAPRDSTVMINNHECQYHEPIAIRSVVINPSGEIATKIGNASLTLQVAATPLTDDERGVAIYSNSVWHETTLAGADGKEMANYIFGNIDVPALDQDTSPIAPYDMTRSMKLNPANMVVQAIFAFIGTNVEILRKELVADEKARKKSEAAKNLARKASEIAQVINEDFYAFRQRITKARAKAAGAADAGSSIPAGTWGDEDVLFGGDEPAEIFSETGSIGAEGDSANGHGEPRELEPVMQDGRPDSPKQGRKVGGDHSKSRQSRGGFSIDFRNMGEQENRAKYNRDARQIVINLDHPQFAAALRSGSIEDPIFLRLAYEVAFTEYALALALELAQNDEYIDTTDPIVDIGETINRVARRAAGLYEAR